ncbi:MAG: terminase family protein [Ferruginibacter sp.]
MSEQTISLEIPHVGQQLVIDSPARFKVLMCGRRWGKTLVSRIIAIRHFLERKRIAIITPEFKLSKELARELMGYFKNDVRKALGIDYNQSDLRITTSKGGVIQFFSGENVDAIRGYKFHYVIIDEASKIPDLRSAWHGAIRPTLSDYKGKALFISTPRGQDFFHSLYLKGQLGENDFASWQFASNTNPHFSDEEFEAARQETPTELFSQEYLAKPMSNADNPFNAEDIAANTISELSSKPTIVYGIDLATSGDWTVIIGLDIDGSMTFFKRFRKSWSETHLELMQLPKDVLKVLDNTGVGSAVVSRLAEEMPNIRPFTFTKESKPKIMWQLISDNEKGKITFNEDVANEMKAFERKKNERTGTVRFEAIKGYHDDCVMALAMANYYRIEAYGVTQWRPELI